MFSDIFNTFKGNKNLHFHRLVFGSVQGSFLSVQPDTHLRFLSRFLETSMFSSFVDSKVIARWVDGDPAQHLFDSRLERERLCDAEQEDPRDSRYKQCTSLFESGTSCLHRETTVGRSIRTQEREKPSPGL